MDEIKSLMSWDGTGKIYSEETVQALQAEIDRLREAQRWIPVGERLPEEYGAYIGWNGEMYIGFTFGDWSTQCPEGVTHWMPLPKPPQEAEGN